MSETSDDVASQGGHRGRQFGRLIIVFAIALVAAGAYGWRCYLDTYHLATVQPRALYRDGNQSPCQFETALRKVQPKTVVSLIDDGELAHPEKPQFKAEEELLARKGIRLERIPVKLGGWPSKEDVEKFNRLASDPNHQPVLVHCAQGVRRTGMMVAAYQMKHMGYDRKKAKDEMLAFGHSERTVNDVKRFIDNYDPASGKVPDQFMPSKE